MQIWTFTYTYNICICMHMYMFIHANKYLQVCAGGIGWMRACDADTKFNNNSAVGKLFDNLIAVVQRAANSS